ncbi:MULTISPECIES: hypothetical protein [Microcoleaceae]|uniref:hypothetical protein n=1 Tax=Microcoleaceae TaxID=1892252 RepID=UPI00188132B1|nr:MULTISPECIES: hypothetical protein [unclassified Tychonema]MBE9120089.1 hypothetical protein [Tychonema sp. LEGE 07199]MBE9132829.1 hypothetical protein [Tychonema sp. LEGE 07196]
MKKLPDESLLLEILEIVKATEAKASEMYEFSKQISHNTQIKATKREEAQQLHGQPFPDN